LLTLASLVLSAAAFVTMGRVDLTGKGPGVLRVAGGVLELNARVPGTVSRVHVHSGQEVKRGATLLTLDATQLQATLQEARQRLSFVEHELEKLLTQSRRTSERSEKLLRREARLARQRLHVQRESNTQIGEQLGPIRELSERGMVARMESDEVEERLRTGVRTQLSLHEDLLRIEERIASLALEEDTQRYHWESERQSAVAAVQAAEVALREAVVLAPTDGVIEAVMVQPGELLRPGALVGKILPSGVPSQVVGFVPERDRAFLKPGDPVRLDVAQLPAAEFGTATARVRRISQDLAAAEEVAEALGPSYELREPHYRVEMELAPDTKPALRAALRPGMLVEAKFVLRRRLLLALLFDPVRRWVE
jgi:multidrug resistance efflux pump